MASNPNKANEPQIESAEADEIEVNDYYFLLQEEGKAEFSANDLVWGKIKSHPWWPGQIFDPRYASEMSLKCRKKDHFLVAYFGDKTFAWVPESQLKPFQPHFLEMEGQSGGASFVSAVGAALEEVSKRVELGLACHCSVDGGGYDNLFENAGVREGTCSVVDKVTVANAFQPESLLGYVWALARCSSRGVVRLELMLAEAQLKAFYRLKGRSQPPIFVSRDGLVEDEVEISNVKRPRGRPRKNRSKEDGSEQERPPNKTEDEEVTDLGRSEKDGACNEVDLKTGTRSSTRTRTRSVKLADHISEDVNLLKDESSLILNRIDETPQNSVTKRGRRAGKENEVTIKEYSSPSEMLSQLYQVAMDPMEEYNFLPMIQGFFIDFRVWYFSNTSDNQEPVKSRGRKRGRKKKVVEIEPACLEVSDPDFTFSPSSNASEDQEPVKSTGRKRGRKKKVVTCEPAPIETSDADFRFSPSSNASKDQEPVKSTGRKRGRKKKVVTCEPAPIETFDADFRYSPSSNASKDQEPVKSTGRKRGRKKKVVTCEPAPIETSDADFRFSPSSNASEDQEPVKSTGRKRGRKKKVVTCEPAPIETSDADFRFSPSSNASEDQEPVKSTGRKRGRKKKVVTCEPAPIETSDADFRFSPSSDSPEDQETAKSMGRKSSRKKKVVSPEPDYIQDSYWSDIILQSSPEREPASKGQKGKGGSENKGRTMKTKAVGESVLLDPMAASVDTEQDNLLVSFSNPHEKQEVKEDSYWSNIIFESSPETEPASKGQTKKTEPAGESVPYYPMDPTMDTEQNNLLVGFSNPHEKQEVKEERIVDETPTALILSFNEYDSIPSAADLIKIFSCYGSLKEEETEVQRKTNRAKVVFKYRHDAENAFSSAGKSNVFGLAFVSYQLRYSPSPKSSPDCSPPDMNYALPTKDGGLERQGQEDIGVAIDNMQS